MGAAGALGIDALLQHAPEMRQRRIRDDAGHLEVGVGIEHFLLALDDELVLEKALDHAVAERQRDVGVVECVVVQVVPEEVRGAEHSVPVSPRMRSSNADVRRRAAVEGLGVARVTASFCADAVRSGELVALLPGYTCAPLKIFALLPGRRLMPRKVKVFLDALEATER